MIFNFEGGNSTYRTASGACISLITWLVTLIFFVQQVQVLIERKGTTFSFSLAQDYLDVDDSFTKDDGIIIAVGVIDFSDARNNAIDNEIEIEFTQRL